MEKSTMSSCPAAMAMRLNRYVYMVLVIQLLSFGVFSLIGIVNLGIVIEGQLESYLEHATAEEKYHWQRAITDAFTHAVMIQKISSLFSGFLVDNGGPKIAGLLGTSFFIAGQLVLYAITPTNLLIGTAFSLLAAGLTPTWLSCIWTQQLFPRKKQLVLAVLGASTELATQIYYFFQLFMTKYRQMTGSLKGIARVHLFYAVVVGSIEVFVIGFFWPMKLPSGEASSKKVDVEAGLKPTTDALDDKMFSQTSGELSLKAASRQEVDVRSSQTERQAKFKDSPDPGIKIPSAKRQRPLFPGRKLSDEASVLLSLEKKTVKGRPWDRPRKHHQTFKFHDRSLKEQLMLPHFWFYLIYFISLYIVRTGVLHSFNRACTQINGPKFAADEALIFAKLATPLSVISCLVIGLIADYVPVLLVASFVGVCGIGSTLLVFFAIRSSDFDVAKKGLLVSYIVFGIYKSYINGSIYSFCSEYYGPKTIGSLSGIGSIAVAAFLYLETIVRHGIDQRYDGDCAYYFLFLTILGFIGFIGPIAIMLFLPSHVSYSQPEDEQIKSVQRYTEWLRRNRPTANGGECEICGETGCACTTWDLVNLKEKIRQSSNILDIMDGTEQVVAAVPTSVVGMVNYGDENSYDEHSTLLEQAERYRMTPHM